MSSEKLQSNLFAFYEKGIMHDVSVVCEGRDIKAHRAVLAAQSEEFCNQLQASKDHGRLELPNVKYKVMQGLIRFMYFGGFGGQDLGPEDCLDALLLAEDWRITGLTPGDIIPLVISQLTVHNCIGLLRHEGCQRYFAGVAVPVCAFIGENFLSMLPTMQAQLLSIPREYLSTMIGVVCRKVSTAVNAKSLVDFCLEHSRSHTFCESACDLLRETKQWQWGKDQPTLLRSPPNEKAFEALEWRIEGVRNAMASEPGEPPARIVCGEYFDWCIRLDYGAEGKLRIVYETATPLDTANTLCIHRFPAAMFEWRVLYRGQDVFHEKPVFICFPENVQLHWSTTLPVDAAELTDEDDLTIMVTMAENPMLGLVLYYFSTDLKTTVFSEDILNRLPHIEYRCLSSYSLVKTHIQGG